MTDIKAILKANGITGEVVDTIADTIKGELHKSFVSKEQYSKKVNSIDELNIKIADLEAKANNKDDGYKSKFEALEIEHNNFKAGIETEKVNNTKISKIKDQLKAEGLNEKLTGLMLKEFDLDKIVLEEDKIKDWENIIKPVKDGYSDFFKVEQTTTGTAPANPPKGELGKKEIYVPPVMF